MHTKVTPNPCRCLGENFFQHHATSRHNSFFFIMPRHSLCPQPPLPSFHLSLRPSALMVSTSPCPPMPALSAEKALREQNTVPEMTFACFGTRNGNQMVHLPILFVFLLNAAVYRYNVTRSTERAGQFCSSKLLKYSQHYVLCALICTFCACCCDSLLIARQRPH